MSINFNANLNCILSDLILIFFYFIYLFYLFYLFFSSLFLFIFLCIYYYFIYLLLFFYFLFALQSFNFERTRWLLFQNRIVCTKLDFYVVIDALRHCHISNNSQLSYSINGHKFPNHRNQFSFFNGAFCFACRSVCVLCPMLPVSLNCPFWILTSDFSNVFIQFIENPDRQVVEFEFEFEFWCSTPLSAKFQLYHGDQF